MVSVIIVANGKSERYGSNKLLEKTNGKYVLQATIDAFLNTSLVNEIIVVSNKNTIDKMEGKFKFINGGDTRAESVIKGLEFVSNEHVMIHDGARPFLSTRFINNIVFSLRENDVVIPYMEVTNCLKTYVDGKVTTVNRDNFLTTQTPQGFKTDLIKEVYNKALKENKLNFTDDCELIEVYSDEEIKLIEGETANIKITNRGDIKK